MRKTLAGLVTAVVLSPVAALSSMTPASADVLPVVPVQPCGTDGTIWSTHQASADWFDYNGDGIFCAPDRDRTPYSNGYDNEPIFTTGDRFSGVRFFSWGGDTGKLDTGIKSINVKQRTISLVAWGQEDDFDLNGCQFRCQQKKLTVDDNDLFFVDSGQGSTLVTFAQFAELARKADRFSVIYNADPARPNLYSVDLTPATP